MLSFFLFVAFSFLSRFSGRSSFEYIARPVAICSCPVPSQLRGLASAFLPASTANRLPSCLLVLFHVPPVPYGTLRQLVPYGTLSDIYTLKTGDVKTTGHLLVLGRLPVMTTKFTMLFRHAPPRPSPSHPSLPTNNSRRVSARGGRRRTFALATSCISSAIIPLRSMPTAPQPVKPQHHRPQSSPCRR